MRTIFGFLLWQTLQAPAQAGRPAKKTAQTRTKGMIRFVIMPHRSMGTDVPGMIQIILARGRLEIRDGGS
jgi:hypothetical protein